MPYSAEDFSVPEVYSSIIPTSADVPPPAYEITSASRSIYSSPSISSASLQDDAGELRHSALRAVEVEHINRITRIHASCDKKARKSPHRRNLIELEREEQLEQAEVAYYENKASAMKKVWLEHRKDRNQMRKREQRSGQSS